MKNGPALVLRGTIIGCLLLGLLGWLLAGQIDIAPTTEVALAAQPSMEVVEKVSELSPCQVSPSYPPAVLQWCEIITDKAIAAGLPPDLVAAVILQESGGDALAYSSSGAVGLMQVMPRDGLAAAFECINGPCFASRPTSEELLEPGFNVEFGSRMLRGLIDRLGSLRQALKAYGPMDVGYRYADTVLAIYENYR